MQTYSSHYAYLEQNCKEFDIAIGLKLGNGTYDVISAHADKCYSYKSIWAEHDILFVHGVMLFLLSYIRPYSDTVRDTNNGFVAPVKWVTEMYKNDKIRSALLQLPEYIEVDTHK